MDWRFTKRRKHAGINNLKKKDDLKIYVMSSERNSDAADHTQNGVRS